MLHHCLIYCIANASYAELIRVRKMRIDDRQFIAPIAILIPSNSRYDEIWYAVFSNGLNYVLYVVFIIQIIINMISVNRISLLYSLYPILCQVN
jgi:hypothetical protein